MKAKKTWGEQVEEELRDDPEFLSEALVLQVNGAIRRRMRELGITQADLAQKLGVSQPYVSKLLNYNGNLTIRSLAALAHALGCEWAEPHMLPLNKSRSHARKIRSA